MTYGSERWRLFCAVEIPAEVRHALVAHAARLRELFPEVSASWTREDNLHLTIKFVGEVEATRSVSLSQAAMRAAAAVERFTIVANTPGVFPKRVLWIGIDDPSNGLVSLHERLDAECASEGFAKDERAFHPHLTLARLRRPQGTRALEAQHKQMLFQLLEVKVDELLVMRSELGSKGSRYTVLSRHPLA